MRLAILFATHSLLWREVTEHLKTANAILHAGGIKAPQGKPGSTIKQGKKPKAGDV